MLKISPLFSGSKGNCTLIRSPHANILLDAGFSCRGIVNALEERGLTPADIDAIIITHEHTDHIGALATWTRRTPTRIYAPERIADLIAQRVCNSDITAITGDFVLSDVAVACYKCSHDAECCFGYKFTCGDSRFACVTDTGRYDDALTEFLWDCEAIMLESNHDEDMLRRGEYSFMLKQRILSPFGHLSNTQAAEVLKRLHGSRVKTVILAHLSEKNNNKELAFNSAVSACAACGAVEGRDICIYVADQYRNEVSVCLD